MDSMHGFHYVPSIAGIYCAADECCFQAAGDCASFRRHLKKHSDITDEKKEDIVDLGEKVQHGRKGGC